MKYIGWVVLIIVCFILGRIMYAPLEGSLVGRGGKDGGKDGVQTVVVQGPGGRVTIEVDLASIKREEVPDKVTLKKRVKVSADGQEGIYLEVGTKARVEDFDGKTLTIGAMAGPMKGITTIASTDLAEQVAALRVQAAFGGTVAKNGPNPPGPTPAPGPGPGPGPAPTPAPGPMPTPAPGPGPAPTPAPGPAPTPTPGPTPNPTPVVDPPAPTPDPAPAAALNAEQIVTAMQDSVKAGSIKEFKLEQVQGWKAGEEEDIDGETYQTGMAAYKAETIFGVKTVQAKALIKDGKVVKWVYAKTGMEIR